MSKRNPKRFFAVLAVIFLVVGTVAGSYFLHIHLLWAALVCINLLTFIAYGFDKRQALRSSGRIPEVILHSLALCGGSPAALAAQLIFHHKNRKISFRAVFFVICLLQIAAIVWFLLNRT